MNTRANSWVNLKLKAIKKLRTDFAFKTIQPLVANLKSKAIQKLRANINSDSGSAIVEFVALAIPLFLPIFIYLNHFSGVSVNEEIARSMAREILRVYVISDDESSARALSGKATQILAQQWKLTQAEVNSLSTELQCSHFPCLSPNGRIKLTIKFTDEQTGRTISASAREHLSPWH